MNNSVLLNLFVAVSALYFAQDIFIPVALAGLISFLLTPVVWRIEKLGIGRITSVMIASLLTFVLVIGVGWMTAIQLTDLGSKAPVYQENLKAKVRSFKELTAEPFAYMKRVMANVRESLNSEIAQKNDAQDATPGQQVADTPVAGTVAEVPVWTREVSPPPSPVDLLRASVAPVLGPLGTLGVVLILSIFILIHREDLRDRFIRLLGEQRLNVTTDALDESASKVGNYLLMQLVVNILYGLPVYIALFLIGVPNAALWGVMATVLRFVPYLGPWIAAACPIALSFAISTDWTLPIYTISVFVFLELISNNIIEPWLYGKNTGLSPVAVLFAAIFWTWMWGTIGLVVSTPLTVCLVVLGKYLPQLKFLTILLGDEPPLDPRVKIYQRLLASDGDEAEKVVLDLLAQYPVPHVFDKYLLPVIILMQNDRQQNHIDDIKEQIVYDGFKNLLRSLSNAKVLSPHSNPSLQQVFCCPARTRADELAGLVMSLLLLQNGIKMQVFTQDALANEMAQHVSEQDSPIILISSMPSSAVTNTRYLLKRLESSDFNGKLIIGIWSEEPAEKINKEKLRERIGVLLDYRLETNLTDAANLIRELTAIR